MPAKSEAQNEPLLEAAVEQRFYAGRGKGPAASNRLNPLYCGLGFLVVHFWYNKLTSRFLFTLHQDSSAA